MTFAPKLSALPAAQRELWPELKQAPPQVVLYRGTALALRLAHRQSIDFDFFSDAPMDPDRLLADVSLLRDATVRQKALNTLTVTVGQPIPVKLSFFGLPLRRVGEPEATSDGVIRVATLLDVAACKMAAIQSRAEAKDFVDIHALLSQGIPLAQMLGAAQAIYGAQFFALVSLKALTWFEDGDLPTLPAEIKSNLRRAAGEVREIPDLRPLAGGISPGAG